MLSIGNVLSAVTGFAVACVLHYFFFLPTLVNTNAIVANAQGKVDVMQQYCKAELEKSGIVKKEK